MVVRDLLWEDGPALAELYLSRYAEAARDRTFGMRLRPGLPNLGEELAEFAATFRSVQEGTALVSVAVVDGAVVGQCTVRMKSARLEDRETGVLAMHVAAAHRNRGVGGELLRHALAGAKPRFEVVLLEVATVNERARRLYERFGFRSYGRLPKWFARDGGWLPGELMWLDLGAPAGSSSNIAPD
jgi:ribosomal protein S18 acetylase RimI-like enzyme